MQTLILTLHIIVCVLLVILVLLQAGKEGMGVIFGGGNSSVFGSGGAGGRLYAEDSRDTLTWVLRLADGEEQRIAVNKKQANDY